MQLTSVIFDDDTSTLDIHTDDGAEYSITNPHYAKTMRDRISVGGQVSESQREWLEQFRVNLRHTNRRSLRDRLNRLRVEIRMAKEIG